MTSGSTSQPKPVVFLAFANEQEGKRYLRELPGEARELRAALLKAEDRGLCERREGASHTSARSDSRPGSRNRTSSGRSARPSSERI